MARRVGFEPTTNRLTADRSATELPPNTRPGPWPDERKVVYQLFLALASGTWTGRGVGLKGIILNTAQCVTLLEKTLMITTPITMKAMPRIAGRSSDCLNRRKPTREIRTMPTALQIA